MTHNIIGHYVLCRWDIIKYYEQDYADPISNRWLIVQFEYFLITLITMRRNFTIITDLVFQTVCLVLLWISKSISSFVNEHLNVFRNLAYYTLLPIAVTSNERYSVSNHQ